MHKKIEECLGIILGQIKNTKKTPHRKHLKHWMPLHHKKQVKSIKDFPFTIHVMDSHQKQASKRQEHIS
jgi:hypothetical protein